MADDMIHDRTDDVTDERREDQCDHELCSCTAAADSDYCSVQCETADASDTLTIACECGHAGCAAEIAATS